MAKKTAGAARKRAGGKGKRARVALHSTNLKFIGAAFDEALKDLAIIRPSVTEKSRVDSLIKRLTALKRDTSRECPQGWYAIFTPKPGER